MSSHTLSGVESYWVLKTRPGRDLNTDHWDRFLEEQAVALGWPKVCVDPSVAGKHEIARELGREYPGEERAAEKIRVFGQEWKRGDLVIVSRGYPPNSWADVLFHGFARIRGDFFVDSDGSWWKFKYPAAIQTVNMLVPKSLYTETLRKGSLMQALHRLTEGEFRRFCDRLQEEYGVRLEV